MEREISIEVEVRTEEPREPQVSKEDSKISEHCREGEAVAVGMGVGVGNAGIDLLVSARLRQVGN